MTGRKHQASHHRAQAGSALVYILIAIALLAALTVSFMEPSSQQTSSQNTFKTVSDLKGQVDTIRSAVQECLLLYPNGDTTIDTVNPGATDEGANNKYPIKPNSAHFTGATIGPAANRKVLNIRCPGNNPGNPNEKNHALVFGGSSGKFLSPIPSLFEDWQYYNGTDGVFFWTQTNKTDAYVTSALAKLDENFSTCESDVVNATSAAVDLDLAATITCPAGYTCFRVWMQLNASAAGPHQDAGCPS